MTSLIDSVYSWLTACPILAGFRVCIDYLPDDPDCCAIENKGDTLQQSCTDGSELRRYRFLISLRLLYGDDPDINGGNAAILEQLRRWIDGGELLPRPGGGRRPLKCAVLSEGYVYYADATTAKYQLEVGMDYFSA